MSLYTYANGINPDYKKLLKSINCYGNGLNMKELGSEIPRFRDVFYKNNTIQILTRYGNKKDRDGKIMYSIKSNKYFIREIPFISKDNYALFEFKKPKESSFKEYHKTEKEVLDSFNTGNKLDPKIAEVLKKIIYSKKLTKKELNIFPCNAKTLEESFSRTKIITLIDREDILNVAKANGWI